MLALAAKCVCVCDVILYCRGFYAISSVLKCVSVCMHNMCALIWAMIIFAKAFSLH